MRETKLSIPLLALVAGTRGLLGLGLGLLVSERISGKRRRKLGWALLAVGIVSTIPIGATIAHRRFANGKPEREAAMPAY